MGLRMSKLKLLFALSISISLSLSGCALDEDQPSAEETSQVESNSTHAWVYIFNQYWGQYLSLAIAGSHGLILSSTAGASTDWYLDATGIANTYRIRSYSTNQCISLTTLSDGATAYTTTCDTNTRNYWIKKTHSVGGFAYYYFQNYASGYCLDTNGGRDSTIGAWDCGSLSDPNINSQSWKVR